jgi:hypothetical protein
MLDKFLDALDDNKEYDFIAQHYHEMSKMDLRTILLEYIYATYCIQDAKEDIREQVRDEIQDKVIFG